MTLQGSLFRQRPFLAGFRARRATFSDARCVSGFSAYSESHKRDRTGWRRCSSSSSRAGTLWARTRKGDRKWQWFLTLWSSWKKRHDTMAWQRYIRQLQDRTGEKCIKGIKRSMRGAQERTARYVGALRAGSPHKMAMPPVGRQLVAYLSPVTQRRRELNPRMQLAFVEVPATLNRSIMPLSTVFGLENLRSWVSAELARLFKTSDILSQLNLLTRITFSLVPITLAFRFKAARLVRRYGEQALAGRFYPTRAFTWSLVATPLVLLGVAYLMSLERTPITGRTRSLFVSDGERAEIVRAFVGDQAAATNADWLLLLRRMLGDEAMGAEPGTLLGGRHLPTDDWRVRLVEDTLRTLEAGIPKLGGQAPSQHIGGLSVPLPHPPLDYASPAPHYCLLVIDRSEPNAFSCGFAPLAGGVGPGVIVVFRGMIDLVVGANSSDKAQQPSDDQRANLAVLLSHELAHLLCSHTLEQHASDLQRPQIRKIGADVVRLFLYPLTFLLGPFVQDAISASLTTGFHDTNGFSSSCESRLHEIEADSVSLRVLAHAGYDPMCAALILPFSQSRAYISQRHALRYWEGRIAAPPPQQSGSRLEGLQWHSMRSGLLRSHPVDAERLAAIRTELAGWRRI